MRRVLKYALAVIVSYTIIFVVSNLYSQSDRTIQIEEEQKPDSLPALPRHSKLKSRFFNKVHAMNNKKLTKLYIESGYSKPPVSQMNEELQAKLKHFINKSSNKSSFNGEFIYVLGYIQFLAIKKKCSIQLNAEISRFISTIQYVARNL